MKKRASNPLVSVIIPTRNRAPLLVESLASLARQTLATRDFEVVVVDDGSSDDTPRVCKRAAAQMSLRYVRIEPAGIAAAKNAGIFVSSAPLLFFFDDDDVAGEELLARHLETHCAHPAEHIAVLGYTEWSAGLDVSEVMRYVTDIGSFLFSYGHIADGQWLDYTYFWGGRSSCKRALLTQHGIFNQAFTFGSEDIELAYRLTRFNLQVIHQRQAVQYMNRSITFAEFCRRCEKQGRSQAVFSRLHAADEIQHYCQIPDVEDRWREIGPNLSQWVRRIEHLEASLRERPPASDDDERRQELWPLYRRTFNAFKAKGIIEAADAVAEPARNSMTISAAAG